MITLSDYLSKMKAEDGSWFKAEDFFPDCVLPDCDYNSDCTEHTGHIRQEKHQHVLPKQRAIFDSTCMYTFSQGGVGSAKTVAFAARTVALSVAIPANEGAVCRLNYKDLYKSSWKDIKATNKRLVDRGKIIDPVYSAKTQGDHSVITYHNGSILYAIQAKNWSEALGASYGLFWVDDCMESPIELFAGDDTSAGLISRLRLPHVAYHADVYNLEQRPHGFLSGMVSTNPPPIGHWSHKLFGDKPGRFKLGDDEVDWIQVASFENPFTGAHYTKALIAVQSKLGKSEATIRRVIFGESIPAYGGIPVFPQFNHRRHVADVKFTPSIPLIRAWDFGYHHPAVVFTQVYKCKYATNHYLTLSEVADAFALTVEDFWKHYVKPHGDALYKDASLILDCGDRAGFRNSASNKDGRSDMKILIQDYHIPFKHRYMLVEPSLQYMRSLLKPKELCPCGLETVLISDKCTALIGALEGGYKYSKPRSGVVKDKPYEDKYFADVACAWRYGAENYVKWGIPWDDVKAMKQKGFMQQQPFDEADHEPWAWMERSEEETLALLTK